MTARPVHLVGIGGAGMSGLARLAAAAGYRVSGTDREDSAALAALRAAGIDARAGHDAGRPARRTRRRWWSRPPSPADNPELAEARRRGLPVLHRSELLAELMAGRRGLAVAGAHGKSTTSAMLVAALGDASACVGATIAGGDGTGAVWGDGPWFVAEADESDRSLLNLAPEAAILLNVDHDHHATFASLEEVREVFRAFVARLPADGLLVVGPDDEARACAGAAPCPVRLVGDVPGAWCRVERQAGRPGFVLAAGRRPAGRRCRSRLAGAPQRRQRGLRAGPGRLVRRARWSWRPGAWPAFAGVGRRMEPRGTRGRRGGGRRLRPPPGRDPGDPGRGARARAPGAWWWSSSPTCPRARGPSAAELGAALGGADVVVVTDVYLAREPPDPRATGPLGGRAGPRRRRGPSSPRPWPRPPTRPWPRPARATC